MSDESQVAWNLFIELRKETLESQRIRAQVIGFKITFVSAAVGLIASNLDKLPSMLLVIPAFAAIFFDLLISSYSFSVKRIGHYCRNHIEKSIRAGCNLPDEFVLWHEFLRRRETVQNLAIHGNLGITLLTLGTAVIALIYAFQPVTSTLLLAALGVFFTYDIYGHLLPRRFERAAAVDTEVCDTKLGG